ncbi:ABC transporter permease [Paenibacillus sp. NPDC058071]|uniref:ABC transporter permease n=1 Tax=Paenibacillus sp. NPDC058071 TaxID=3346326 RepID=UPI0036DCB2E7
MNLLKLMKLEIRRNRMRAYMSASLIICMVLVGFIYFISYVAKVENEVDFQKYPNIFLFTAIISMIMFSILSAVMYARFVIEEYSGKKLLLLFSYPINRKEWLLSKLAIVMGFTTTAMILCNIPPFLLFWLTESISPIVNDSLTLDLLFSMLKIIIVLSICVNGISLIAMRIGFIQKSIPTTIVASFILCALFGNAVIGSFGNDTILMLILLIIVAIGVMIILNLMNTVNRMEIE